MWGWVSHGLAGAIFCLFNLNCEIDENESERERERDGSSENGLCEGKEERARERVSDTALEE